METGLKCPYEVSVHDQVEELERRTNDWTSRHGLIADSSSKQRMTKTRIGLMAGLIYPYGDLDRVELIAEWFVWGFAFDDRYIDELDDMATAAPAARKIPLYQQIVEHPGLDFDRSDPYARALHDICIRLSATAANEQVNRFVGGVAGFLMGCACAAVLRAGREMPTVAEYRALRRHTIGLDPNFALIDYAGRFELPANIWCDPKIRALNTHAANAVAYANDVYSQAKEHSGEINLPKVLSRNTHCPNTQATMMTVDMYEAEIAAFDRLAGVLGRGRTGHGSVPVHRYILGLQKWISGNDAWSKRTGRYQADAVAVDWK